MIITVDVDLDRFRDPDLALWTVFLRILYISKGRNVRWIEIRETEKGYHIYIDADCPNDIYRSIAVRSFLLDDPDRIELDLKKRNPMAREVLFETKTVKMGTRILERSVEIPRAMITR